MAIVTQIGSLPFDSVEKAVEYSLRHDIPFLPELPKLGDAMLDYIKNPGKLSCLEEFKKHSYDLAKAQCVGPATLMQSRNTEDKENERNYTEEEAIARISIHLNTICAGLDAKLLVVFLDEPGLGNSGCDYIALWDAIFCDINRDVVRGVHTCGNMDWDKLFAADINMISFDASQYDLTIYSKYNEFRGRNGKIAWGISRLENIRDFHEGDLITMPCGLGGMNKETGKRFTEEECEKALEMMKNAAERYYADSP